MRSPKSTRFSIAGFTMIELMVVVAIIAILAAIAVPLYGSYIKRGKIVQATTALGDGRSRYEQYFLDNRTYVGACAIIKPIIQGITQAFVMDCAAGETVSTYAITATGDPTQGMEAAFIYTIDQSNAKTSAGPSGWAGNASCWALRQDGSCS